MSERRVMDGRMESVWLCGTTSVPSSLANRMLAPPVYSPYVRDWESRYMFSS